MEERVLSLSIAILKPFTKEKSVMVMVPPVSRLRAENNMRVNEMRNKDLILTTITETKVLIPTLSNADMKMAQSMDNIEEAINRGGSPLMVILKYSFFLRFVSNNQIIVFSSLLEAKLPINLHISVQALSSGLKPKTEKFRQLKPELESEYKIIFGQKVGLEDLNPEQVRIRKIWLSGYTTNILVNDPFFV